MVKKELSQPADGCFVFSILENNSALFNKGEDSHTLPPKNSLGLEFSLTHVNKMKHPRMFITALLLIAKKAETPKYS